MTASLNWNLDKIATALQARVIGTATTISGISTDTRTIAQGDLFIALRGPRFDAHDFAMTAVQEGATAVLVDHPLNVPVAQIVVDDTRLALGRLASAWRQQFKIPVIAITGSNGKTTVKEMLAAICAQRGQVLATQGNLNNDIGVPLTLLRLNHGYQCAVIELGANHPNEIAYLTKLVKPDVALITNAGPAHLEGFGSLQGVALAKGEIFSGLSKNGTAIINSDDPFAAYWQGLCIGHPLMSFGFSNTASVSASSSTSTRGAGLQLQTPQGGIEVQLPLLGKHNVRNALAAASAALAVGCDLQDIQRGLHSMPPVKGRLQLKPGKHGSHLIDDTYNANPASLRAAVDVLSEFPSQRFLALGDMGELGAGAEQLHHEAGVYAQAQGIDRLYTVGGLAKHAATGFGPSAKSFSEHSALIASLIADLSEQVTLLIKGSRAMHMENVVQALTQSEGQ
ncbi:MAG: UDP-N-acetylmuramoyl-tripeptide--D-alanyl-D-alanine ligase [Gammaproteobacteria bacterium]|nr:UDP-N-acetylmuramoyl-tripeptide--D-alanyl-D-alanine ligase [Gammaproteobacteria bacterium]